MIDSLLRRLGAGQPEVVLAAYAADCCVHGRLRLTAGRLSDMLNQRDEIVVTDARVISYIGTDDLGLERLTLYRDDLYAVLLSGPRGSDRRWRETEAVAIGIKAGPYLVRGHIHVAPGEDGVAAFGRGREMVALTDGWIARTDGARGEEAFKIRVEALLVNCRLVDWVVAAEADDAADAEEALAWPDHFLPGAEESPV